MLNSVIKTISYSGEGVNVTLVDGTKLEADYALVSFSLGVLQYDDVTWEPKLPAWKTEAIQSMTMVKDILITSCLSLTCKYRVHIRRFLCNSLGSFGSIQR